MLGEVRFAYQWEHGEMLSMDEALELGERAVDEALAAEGAGRQETAD